MSRSAPTTWKVIESGGPIFLGTSYASMPTWGRRSSSPPIGWRVSGLADKTWKAFERWICGQFFGCKRAGPVGRTGPDCASDVWAVECRQRRQITYGDLEEWIVEVRRESGGRLPVLVVRKIRGAGIPAPVLFILDGEAWQDIMRRLPEVSPSPALASEGTED